MAAPLRILRWKKAKNMLKKCKKCAEEMQKKVLENAETAMQKMC
jgi:hypothetical protein